MKPELTEIAEILVENGLFINESRILWPNLSDDERKEKLLPRIENMLNEIFPQGGD